jgi:hypothetical protein
MCWLNKPVVPEEKIFDVYLEERGFKEESRKLLREIACLSSQALLKGRYCSLGEVGLTWMRDDVIGGAAQLYMAFKKFLEKNQVNDVLQEKMESVRLWRKIHLLSTSIEHTDEDLRQFIEGSCEYGVRLFHAVACGWKVLLRHRDFFSSLEGDITAFYKAWEDYQHLPSEYPGCATLFRGKDWNWPGEILPPGLFDAVREREMEFSRGVIKKNKGLVKSVSCLFGFQVD